MTWHAPRLHASVSGTSVSMQALGIMTAQYTRVVLPTHLSCISTGVSAAQQAHYYQAIRFAVIACSPLALATIPCCREDIHRLGRIRSVSEVMYTQQVS